jgi:hypothetical protein
MKRRYADKWSTDVLEQIATCCNIASTAKTETDWELFLNAIYDAAVALPNKQRTILLLSQEHGLSFSDIGRAMNMPHSTVMNNMTCAVNIIVEHLKHKSLIDITVRGESRVAEQLYCERFTPEAHDAQTRFGFYYDAEPPWFYDDNPLLDGGGEDAS